MSVPEPARPPADIWSPIADLPPNYSPLHDPALDSLLEVWNDQRDSLRNSPALEEFNRRLEREWAIETGVIEHLYSLDRGTTEVLIDQGINAALISHDSTDRDPAWVAQMISDQEGVVRYISRFVAERRQITKTFIKQIHQIFTEHQEAAPSRDQFGSEVRREVRTGQWKLLPNFPKRPGGSPGSYCPPEHVDSEMDRLLQMHSEHMTRGVPAEVEAAWLHHRFTQIHPFEDGNGRVARAIASLVLIELGWFPLVIQRNHRDTYIAALEAADGGDLHPLVQMIAQIERQAFVRALQLSGAAKQEAERVDQVIESLREVFARQDAAVRQRFEAARELADGLVGVGTRRLTEVRNRLDDQLRGMWGFRPPGVEAAKSTEDRHFWFARQTDTGMIALGLLPNQRDYRSWVRLRLGPDASLLLTLSALGEEFRGVVGAVVLYLPKTPGESGRLEDEAPQVVSDSYFQVNYRDDFAKVSDRFEGWLERAIVLGLEAWRRTQQRRARTESG